VSTAIVSAPINRGLGGFTGHAVIQCLPDRPAMRGPTRPFRPSRALDGIDIGTGPTFGATDGAIEI
jgi:hypothetical protein